jgi:signal transduction histidine kinase
MPSAEEISAQAWQRVGVELVAGIHHALNNRSGALAAIAQVLEDSMGRDHPLREAFVQEVERLQTTVRSLRWLPRSRSGRPEPVDPRDLVSTAATLYHYHHAVRDTPLLVETEAGVLPVWAEPVRLGHVVLSLMVAAGQIARRSGATVRAGCSGDEEVVEIRIETVPAEVPPAWPMAGENVAPLPGSAMRGWAESLGGSLEMEEAEECACFSLRLPTLPAVRRRERES